ncbi:SMP-30/gluconolactonase/LRE family protein [Novosphingobium sp. AP12]|uniref:SMP-30/gluconolactonase/LRE family protein n=1 Tax=Novosphingobium sp. AP12 TaxID=1144305 RepID=UPI000271F102|nr:SMP-30/gluconolactonase/LRE family protein [Novosphingobium sp. AP12]EJL34350.1 gluconolactonase [Novosphingobium sp. AP12]
MIDRRAVLAGLAALTLVDATVAKPASTAAFSGIRRVDPELDRIVAVDAPVKVLATGFRWAEGPVWIPDDGGYLLFGDPGNNVVHRWSERSGVTPFLSPSGLQTPVPPGIREPGLNGIALDGKGGLIGADSGSRAIVRVDLATRRRTVLAERFEGKRFNSPNDLCIAASGAIYFSDPIYGLADGDDSPLRELPWCGLYRLLPGGKVTLLDRTNRRPNGVALSPDERTLYLALSDEKRPEVLAYTLDGRGMPTGRSMFRDMRPEYDIGLPGLPDGIKVGSAGDVFATGPGGVHVCSADGRLLGMIGTGKAVANCALASGSRLFMTSSDSLAVVKLASN